MTDKSIWLRCLSATEAEKPRIRSERRENNWPKSWVMHIIFNNNKLSANLPPTALSVWIYKQPASRSERPHYAFSANDPNLINAHCIFRPSPHRGVVTPSGVRCWLVVQFNTVVKAAGGSCRDDPVIATATRSRRLLSLPRHRYRATAES